MGPTLYLIHFDAPVGGKSHYLGYTEIGLAARMSRHLAGHGASLTRRAVSSGIGWQVVRTWPDATRTMERKKKKAGHMARLCPICRTPLLAAMSDYLSFKPIPPVLNGNRDPGEWAPYGCPDPCRHEKRLEPKPAALFPQYGGD